MEDNELTREILQWAIIGKALEKEIEIGCKSYSPDSHSSATLRSSNMQGSYHAYSYLKGKILDNFISVTDPENLTETASNLFNAEVNLHE